VVSLLTEDDAYCAQGSQHCPGDYHHVRVTKAQNDDQGKLTMIGPRRS
jgi:hypothetical protein